MGIIYVPLSIWNEHYSLDFWFGVKDGIFGWSAKTNPEKDENYSGFGAWLKNGKSLPMWIK